MASNNNRRRGIVGRLRSAVVGEMTGKDDEPKFTWFRRTKSMLFTNGGYTTVDYTRNDYELSRSLYYGSAINSNREANSMLLGSAFARPIINTAAAFAVGLGFKVSISEKGKDEDDEASQAINDWVEGSISAIYDTVTHGYRDGDAYLYVDELGSIEEFDAKDVKIKLDTLTGEVVGYDVEEVVEEDNPQTNRTVTYTIKKMFRRDSIRYEKYDEHGKFQEVLFERVFTINGTITPTENQEFYEGELVERALPIIHLANDREPRAVYGNSELQNVYVYMKQYHAVLDSSTKGVIYNGTPVLVLKGVTNSAALATDADDDEGDGSDKGKLLWGQDSTIEIDGDGSAEFLTAGSLMGDADVLLKKYFNLIVEASETPEYVFGTAVQSSLASTETQVPVLLQKTERKRTKLQGFLTLVVKAYIDRQIRLSNPIFRAYKDKEVEVTISFPELASEDKRLTLEIVTFLHDRGLISDETALKLTVDDKVADIDEELENAKKQKEEANKANQALPDQKNRVEKLLDEELANEDEADKERARQVAIDNAEA